MKAMGYSSDYLRILSQYFLIIEMMPPPYSPSVNASYVNFNKGSRPSDSENEADFTKGEENDEIDDEEEEDSEGDGSDNQISTSKECVPFISNLCLDVSYYPK